MLDSTVVFVAGLCAGGGAAWLLAQARSARHLARLAALETELACERNAAKEKLELLDDAQRRLSETFQALSAEALRRNNTSFLELANVSLERFQESAKGDLEKRQTAIHDLVKPVRESLEKVDAKIQEIEKTRAGAYEALSKKAYWEQFAQAPEFVVLFLPGESFFSAALEHDPALIEYGTERCVILATPTTLISLLKAVFYGWRQENLAKNAEEISRLGRELYKRLADMGGHMERMGRSLNAAVEHFNKLAATTESRVLVTARKFRELEPAQPGNELEPVAQVETIARQLQAPELSPVPAQESAAPFS